MEIIADDIGKKYGKEWVIRNLSFTVPSSASLAIVGSNGSGKSSLLRILSGASPPSAGEVFYQFENRTIFPEQFYQYIAIAAPYLELIEEMTLLEIVSFHKGFKSFQDGRSSMDVIETMRLTDSTHKEIRNFSSGMKQRVKLGLSIFSDTPILLLDEPCSNLDPKGIDWYLGQLSLQVKKRTILICSNQPYEYPFCQNTLHLGK